MSRQLSSTLTFLFLIAIFVAAHHAEENSVTFPRAPASVSLSKKELILGSVDPAPFHHTEKMHGPLSATIERTDSKSSSSSLMTLRATITSSDAAVSNVEFHWAIPSGLHVIRGELSGQVAEVSPDQPAYLEVVLEGDISSGTNRQIHLLTSGHLGETRFASSAQFNTNPEQNLAQKRQQVLMKAQAVEPPALSRVKVFE